MLEIWLEVPKGAQDSLTGGAMGELRISQDNTTSTDTSTGPKDQSSTAGNTNSKKRKASQVEPRYTLAYHAILSLPVIAMSEYLREQLDPAVTCISETIIKEYAQSKEQVHAMMAVEEFMQTGQLPLYCTLSVLLDQGSGGSNGSLVERLVEVLKVANKWKVQMGIKACCNGICKLEISEMSCNDCYALDSLPAELLDQPDMACIADIAIKIVQDHARSHGLEMLRSLRLGFRSLLLLLSSDEGFLISEDEVALLLSRNFGKDAYKKFSEGQVKQLKDQLRCPQMSRLFLLYKLPTLSCLSIINEQRTILWLLFNLPGFCNIPSENRLDSVAGAWYKGPRENSLLLPDRNVFELKLSFEAAALGSHLGGAAMPAVLGKGAPPSITFKGSPVAFCDATWRLTLQLCPTDGSISLCALPNVQGGAYHNNTACKAGIYVEITFRLESTDPVISVTDRFWIGSNGASLKDFAHVFGKQRLGDPSELAWWREFIVDGQVTFGATVRNLIV